LPTFRDIPSKYSLEGLFFAFFVLPSNYQITQLPIPPPLALPTAPVYDY
jgi:hypothetical protein